MLGLRERATQKQRPEGVAPLGAIVIGKTASLTMSGNPASRESNKFDFVRSQTMKLRDARRRRFSSAHDLAEEVAKDGA